MTWIALLVLLAPEARTQDSVQQQIEEFVREFQAAAEAAQALSLLSAQLTAMGNRATDPLARRLAEDLRDGMASTSAPAFIEALMGRPEALPPLQSAFRDATTSAAGRIELAGALSQLEDARSWREGLLAILADRAGLLEPRLRAARLLLPSDDERIRVELKEIVETLPRRSPEERARVIELLESEGLRDLLQAARGGELPRGGADEPRVVVVDDPPVRIGATSTARPAPKKRETSEETFFTLPVMVAGGATLVLLALFLAFRQKG